MKPINLHKAKAAALKALAAKEEARQAEIERQQLQNHLRAEAAAAAQKEEDRKTMLRNWLANGGSAADFDKNFEALYKDLVYQRTLIQTVAGVSTLPKHLRDKIKL